MSGKVLILGSNSFSGAHFADYCLTKGLTVAAVSRSEEADPLFLPYCRNPRREKFLFRQFDLNRNLSELMSFIQDFAPEYIVNFAAQGMVAQSWSAPEQWLMTNTVSPVRLHDQLRKLRCLRKFVQISTPEVYGNCEKKLAENYCYNPSTPYAVSKAAVDMSLMTFFRNYGFPVVFTRSANVYGPCQQLYRIIPLTAMKILQGKKLQLHGGGRSVRSFIHIRDVADGTFRAMCDGVPGEVYHFSTDRQISIRDLVVQIASSLGAEFEDCVENVPDRPGKDNAYVLSSEKARSVLGWADRIPLETGISETIDWVRDNFAKLNKFPCEYIHKE